jgi:hypothetical protein
MTERRFTSLVTRVARTTCVSFERPFVRRSVGLRRECLAPFPRLPSVFRSPGGRVRDHVSPLAVSQLVWVSGQARLPPGRVEGDTALAAIDRPSCSATGNRGEQHTPGVRTHKAQRHRRSGGKDARFEVRGTVSPDRDGNRTFTRWLAQLFTALQLPWWGAGPWGRLREGTRSKRWHALRYYVPQGRNSVRSTAAAQQGLPTTRAPRPRARSQRKPRHSSGLASRWRRRARQAAHREAVPQSLRIVGAPQWPAGGFTTIDAQHQAAPEARLPPSRSPPPAGPRTHSDRLGAASLNTASRCMHIRPPADTRASPRTVRRSGGSRLVRYTRQ